jgi:hypothetical protein
VRHLSEARHDDRSGMPMLLSSFEKTDRSGRLSSNRHCPFELGNGQQRTRLSHTSTSLCFACLPRRSFGRAHLQHGCSQPLWLLRRISKRTSSTPSQPLIRQTCPELPAVARAVSGLRATGEKGSQVNASAFRDASRCSEGHQKHNYVSCQRLRSMAHFPLGLIPAA